MAKQSDAIVTLVYTLASERENVEAKLAPKRPTIRERDSPSLISEM